MRNPIPSAALVAVAAGAFAQVPTLNYVKTLNDGFNGPDPFLLNQNIGSVAVDGSTMFYSGFRGGSNGEVRLIKVLNWQTANPTYSILATDADSSVNRDCHVMIQGGKIWWATSMGDATVGTAGCNLYYLDYNGAIPGDAAGNFSDGVAVMGNGEIPSANYQGFNIDPGFAGSGNSAIAACVFGSTIIRRFVPNTGAISTTTGYISHTTGTYNASSRDNVFDENGNCFWRINNELVTSNRINDGGGFNITGFGAQTLVPGTGLTSSSNQFQNVIYVPGGPGYSPFVIANDYTVSSTTGSMKFFLTSGGSPFLTLTGSPTAPWTARFINAYSAELNGTRYVYLAGFKGTTQGVDIYQIGDSGKVQGNLTLQDWVPADSGYAVPVKFEIFDNGIINVLDSKTQGAIGATSSYSFYSTARGDVWIAAKPAGFLRRMVNATLGASPVTADFSFINGDVDDDNEVGPGDFGMLSASFGIAWDSGIQTYSEWKSSDDGKSDLDGDGEVGPSDFGILSANFGQAGD